MSRNYYKIQYRLEGAEAYLLWFTNEQDGVITTPEGRMPSFSTEAALVAYAKRNGVSVSGEAATLHDFDALQAWADDPRPDTVDCSNLLSAWNLFSDVARSMPSEAQAFARKDKGLTSLYNKLFWGNNLPAVTPNGHRFDPKWSTDELVRLAEVIAAGLQLFRYARIEAV